MLLFYCILNTDLSRRDMERVVWTMIVCFLVQVPVIVGQAVAMVQSGGGLGPDSLRGTFAGANNLSYAALFPLFTFLGWREFRVTTWGDRLVLCGLMAVLIAGQGRLAICLFVIVMLYMGIRRLSSGRIPLKFIGPPLVFASLLVLYFLLTNARFVREYNLWRHFTESEFEVSGGSARYLYYPLTLQVLAAGEAKRLLFGLGPGMYGSFAGFMCMTPMTEYLANVFHQKELGVDPYVSSQIIPIWGEVGFVGLAVYFILLFKIHRYAVSRWLGTRDRLVKGLAAGLIAGSLLMIIGSFFNPVFEVQTSSYPYWLLLGLLVRSQDLAGGGNAPA